MIGNKLYLNSLRLKSPELLSNDENILGNVLIDKSAKISK